MLLAGLPRHLGYVFDQAVRLPVIPLPAVQDDLGVDPDHRTLALLARKPIQVGDRVALEQRQAGHQVGAVHLGCKVARFRCLSAGSQESEAQGCEIHLASPLHQAPVWIDFQFGVVLLQCLRERSPHPQEGRKPPAVVIGSRGETEKVLGPIDASLHQLAEHRRQHRLAQHLVAFLARFQVRLEAVEAQHLHMRLQLEQLFKDRLLPGHPAAEIALHQINDFRRGGGRDSGADTLQEDPGPMGHFGVVAFHAFLESLDPILAEIPEPLGDLFTDAI